MKFLMLLALAIAVTGCDGCNPDPDPDPDATPAPPQPLGTITKILPSAVPGSLGSIDIYGGQLYEYCQGEAAIYVRRIWDGQVESKVELDPRLTKLWAVAWDQHRGCWWGTNPECENIDFNLVQMDEGGNVIGGGKMMGGHSTNWIRNYDCDVNEGFSAGPNSDGYQIKPWDIFIGSLHFSLNKWEFDNVDDPGHYVEAWWFKSDITHRAVTRTGNTFWAAEWGGNRVIEYAFAPRKAVATRTGRVITLPGYVCSSLKVYDGQMWAKARKDGQSCILAISLGE